MNIFFARHGESEANIKNIISNRGGQYPLTINGQKQAANLAIQLKDAGIAGIFCSPIQRAMETAQIVGALLKVPVARADALREFDCGVMEGRSDDEAWFEIGHAVRMWFEQNDLDYRIPEGESCTEVRVRFNTLVNKLIEVGGNNSYLLVSHGGTLRLTVPVLFHNLPKELYQDRFFGYTDFARAEVLDGKLYCREWCGRRVDNGILGQDLEEA
jgi:probable phosphoglycerate mutase